MLRWNPAHDPEWGRGFGRSAVFLRQHLPPSRGWVIMGRLWAIPIAVRRMRRDGTARDEFLHPFCGMVAPLVIGTESAGVSSRIVAFPHHHSLLMGAVAGWVDA